MAWSTAGRIVNPTAGQVMADTGAVPSTGLDLSQCFVIMTSTVACFFVIERRNAANSAVISEQGVACAANATEKINFPPPLSLAGSERVRVTINGAVTGQAQASIIWQ